jgi:hypothetical protein
MAKLKGGTRVYGTATVDTELRFLESAVNGSNYVGFQAPTSISTDRIWTLPSADGTNGQVLTTNGSGVLSWSTASGGSGVTDGDKGDITVSASGATWTIDNTAVTYAKIQNVTTSRILGRSTAGSGSVEEISIGTGLSLSGSTLSATGGSSNTITIDNKTGAYTIISSDLGKIINCTSGSFTVSLTAAATLGSGFNCWIRNSSGLGSTDSITVDPSGTETIDSLATIVLRTNEQIHVVCTGTNFIVNRSKLSAFSDNLSGGGSLPVASGRRAVAIGNGAVASGEWSNAFGQDTSATSKNSTAIGSNSNVSGSQAVTGLGAMALGGSYASGTDSFAAAIANNTSTYGATDANAIAIGPLSKASGPYSIAIGWSNTAGNRSICIGGNGSTATDNSVCIGSWLSTISHAYSATLGGGRASDRGQQNRWAYSLVSSPGLGLAQGGYFVFYAQTTDATVTGLRSNNSAIGTGNNLANLSNNCAYVFSGLVIARQQASQGTSTAAWKVEGIIRRESTAGTTTIVSQNITTINNTPNWSIAFVADTTDGALRINVTGAAATNIRWVATLSTSEVVYA